MRTVTAAIERGVLDRFEERGVRYLRHYRLHVDLQWEDVFQTNDRDQLARFCSENDIHHEWLDDETLRTEQICQGVAAHPVTGEKVFFNQAHLFHVSSLGEKLAADMIGVFGRDRLPRDAKFGDGQEIETEDLAAIRAAFNSAAVDWDWRPGDVVVLDNMRFAHGRRSYSGKRRVLAALLNPYRAEDARRIS
jgi:alpha-ketoglutarate-dependent taurine dioxygenase